MASVICSSILVRCFTSTSFSTSSHLFGKCTSSLHNLQVSFLHSSLMQVKTVFPSSQTFGCPHLTQNSRPSISAFFKSSSCTLWQNLANTLGSKIRWSIWSENLPAQSARHEVFVVFCPIWVSTPALTQLEQNQ